jgi:hypothetical protein
LDRNKIITGQVVLRDAAMDTENIKDGTDRKLMMVVGVIAVPKEMDLKGEHKYTICSLPPANRIESLFQMVDPDFGMAEVPEFEEIELVLFPETGENLTSETTGLELGGIIIGHHRWRT